MVARVKILWNTKLRRLTTSQQKQQNQRRLSLNLILSHL